MVSSLDLQLACVTDSMRIHIFSRRCLNRPDRSVRVHALVGRHRDVRCTISATGGGNENRGAAQICFYCRQDETKVCPRTLPLPMLALQLLHSLLCVQIFLVGSGTARAQAGDHGGGSTYLGCACAGLVYLLICLDRVHQPAHVCQTL
jgi:hypothetical protein